MTKCRIDQPVAHMFLLCKDVLSLACTKFFHPIVHMYLSRTGLVEPLYRSTSSEPLPEWLSGRAGWIGLEWNTNTSPDRVSRFICFSVWSEAPWTREEERIKLIYYHVAKKVRAWQKPPVVRRRAVEWPPPSKAYMTTSTLDMGQTEENQGQKPSSFFLECDIHLMKSVWLYF